MFKRFLIRGSVLVAGFMASQALIEKLEKSSKKRKTVPVKVETKEEVKLTEEDIKKAFNQAVEIADKMEEEAVGRKK